jgi:hypothetical protein
MKCSIRELIGENCITLEDGQRIYDLIHPELQAGRAVEIDFSGTTVFASPFFNAGFGQLLKDIEPGRLNELLKVANLVPAGLNVLKRVIENAKQYYSDPQHKAAVDAVVRSQSEDK